MRSIFNDGTIDKNFELAEAAYEHYKKHGVMPTNLRAGQAQKAINKSLLMFNEMVDSWGIEDLQRFMLTDFTVSEIGAIDMDIKPEGEHVSTTVKGAAIIGPKIGNGFFSNLYGNFDALTMDRWLVRTWGRWNGTLIIQLPHHLEKAKKRLGASLSKVLGSSEDLKEMSDILGIGLTQKMSIDDLAFAIQEASTDPKLRERFNATEIGEEFRKSGNSLAKYIDGQKEAPAGPEERTYIRSIFSQILDELHQLDEYQDLVMSDLQAVLWYAEKRLYESAKDDTFDDEETEGYSDESAPDYANAAAAIARSKGIDPKKIKSTLKRESKDGRATNARRGDAQEGLQAQQGKQATSRSFTSSEKRAFIRSRAVIRVRRSGINITEQSQRSNGQYTGTDSTVNRGFGLLKNLGATWAKQWKPSRKLSNIYRRNGMAAPTYYELVANDLNNAQRFVEAITASKASHGKQGVMVDAYSAEEYQVMRLFLAEDGSSGFALTKDGEIDAVFSHKPGNVDGVTKNSSAAVIELAIAAGGNKLNAFGDGLPDIYAAHGFVTVSRIKWDDEQAPKDWDKETMGEPDVVFMVLDSKYFGRYTHKDGKLFKGENAYNEAYAAQARAVKRLLRHPDQVFKQSGREDINNGQLQTSSSQGELSGSGNLRGSNGLLAESGGQTSGNEGRDADGSLTGLPRDIKGFNPSHFQPAEQITIAYMEAAGLPYNPPSN